MTIRELMQTSLLKDAVIAAGAAGINNDISWCMPDTELLRDRWIMPGALMIHTHQIDDYDFNKTFNTFLSSRPAGLITFVRPDELSDYYLRFYDETAVPLICVPNTHSVLSFTKRFFDLFANRIETEHITENWLRELCFSKEPPRIEAETLLQIFGYPDETVFQCLLFYPELPRSFDYLDSELTLAGIRNYLIQYVYKRGSSPLCVVVKNALAAFLPLDSRHQPLKANADYLKRLVGRLREQMSLDNLKVCSGSQVRTPLAFSESYLTASQIHLITQNLGITKDLCLYDDWYPYTFFLHESKASLEAYVNRMFGPILDKEDYFKTLAFYLHFGENIKRTAEFMHYHDNTMKYRINRIAKLLGVDLRDSDTRFRLRLALVAHRYLTSLDETTDLYNIHS